MIDRGYLPFKSAREYQDRGMMKWMGFFLSEHATSLSQDSNRVDMTSLLEEEEKLSLLNQLYSSQLRADFLLKGTQLPYVLSGQVNVLSTSTVVVKGLEGYRLVPLSDILDITLSKEKNDE